MKDKRMPPTIANGQICYFEMPSKDVAGSESFYRKVFEWNIRRQGDGSVAFDDAAGEVSGSWVLGRPPMREVGLLVYIMVDSVAATLEEVVANGGEIVQPIGGDAPEITARFRDPSSPASRGFFLCFCGLPSTRPASRHLSSVRIGREDNRPDDHNRVHRRTSSRLIRSIPFGRLRIPLACQPEEDNSLTAAPRRLLTRPNTFPTDPETAP